MNVTVAAKITVITEIPKRRPLIPSKIGPLTTSIITSITPLNAADERVCLILSKSPSRLKISPDFLLSKNESGNLKMCDK